MSRKQNFNRFRL